MKTTIKQISSLNWQRALMLLIISVGLSLPVYGGSKSTVPVTQCPLVASPIKIDGKLDDKAWAETSVLSPFVTVHGDHYPVAQTEVRMLRNQRTIMFAIKVFEPEMTKVMAKITDHDGGVWKDDSIEIFIKADNSDDYYHFLVNSAGVRGESKNRQTKWNGTWQAQAGRFARGWTLEIAIPAKTVGLELTTGGSFRFNVCRERPHAREYSAWSNPHGSFHNKAFFAKAVLVDRETFWWSLRQPGKITTAASFLTLEAQGQLGSYNIETITYNATVKKVTRADKIKFIAGDRHSFEAPFKVPGMAQPGVRLVAYDKTHKVIFATGILPLKISDPTEYELARAKHLLKAITGNTQLKAWQQRLASLQQKPDIDKLKKLSQELEIVNLTAKLPKTASSSTALTFTVPPFKLTQYNYLPTLTELKQSPIITGCKGEYEPASINLLALTKLNKVKLTISDLKNKNSQYFPASAIEVRVVKNWYQAGTALFVSSQPVLVPELLVKDDSTIIPNAKTQRNEFKFDEKVGPVVPKRLLPVNLPAFSNRQFWILAHIPKNQPAGPYRGKITFTSNNQLLATVPFTITVLPVTMEPTKATFSMYNHARHSLGTKPDRDIFYEKMLAMCKAYGMDSLVVQEGKRVDKHGKDYSNYKFNEKTVAKAFALRRKYGMNGPIIYFGLHWMDGWLDRIWKLNATTLKKGKDPVIAAYIKACRRIKELAVAEGFAADEVFIYTYDEPGYDPTGEHLKQARLINAFTHQAGVKTAEAITIAGAEQLGVSNLDLPIFSGENLQLGQRKKKTTVPFALHYYHPLEDPRHDRLLSGLVVWYNRLDGAMPYALASLGGWDDWKGYGSYRPERYIYDGKRTPIPTVQLEAFREGIDDYKYLEMIERRCNILKKRSLTTKQQAVLTAAMTLLNQPPKVFTGSFAQVKSEVTAADFTALRRQMQQLLIKLNQIIATTKSGGT